MMHTISTPDGDEFAIRPVQGPAGGVIEFNP